MKYFIALLFVVLGAISPAHAAYVYDGYPTGPGGFSTPYPAVNPEVYAGLVQINYNDNPILMMSDDYANRTNADTWMTTLYTRADIQNGAPVEFTKEQYARAGYVMVGYFPMDQYPNSMMQLFAIESGNDDLATINKQIWEIFASTTCPLTVFPSGCSEPTDTYDWSKSMLVAGGLDEYLIPINTAEALGILAITGQSVIPAVPEPSDFWLLMSGLIIVGSIVRRRGSLQESGFK